MVHGGEPSRPVGGRHPARIAFRPVSEKEGHGDGGLKAGSAPRRPTPPVERDVIPPVPLFHRELAPFHHEGPHASYTVTHLIHGRLTRDPLEVLEFGPA